MKNQIVLVGGQFLPIYIGIREFPPSKLHFITSEESGENISLLTDLIKSIPFTEHRCNPYNFSSVTQIIQKIIDEVKDPEILINITSGTKVMALAAQSLIHSGIAKTVYINHDNTYTSLPNYISTTLKAFVTAKEFFLLSGHSFTGKPTQSISAKDLIAA